MKRISLAVLITVLIGSGVFFVFFHPPEPEIFIKGNKYHAIYNEPVKIHFENKRRLYHYQLYIDGKKYKEGTAVNRNGKHLIKAEISFSGKTVDKTFHLTIDMEKPGYPLVNIEPSSIHLKQAAIHVKEEPGIDYRAYVDNRPWLLNKAITQPGEHQLKIISSDQSNGLKNIDIRTFHIFETAFSKEEVRYFLKIALGTEYNPNDKFINKWTEPIVIKSYLETTKEDRDMIKKTAKALSRLTGLDISVLDPSDKRKENMSIYFPKDKDMAKYQGPTYRNNWGYFNYFDSDNMIYKAYLLIDRDLSQDLRNEVILEEITQALGLGNDTYDYKDSVFQQEKNQAVTHYSAIDKKVIQLLYLKEVEPGMDKEAILETLSPIIR
ncbi:DUF2927 domain-containing protein [Sporolactobacillus sp. THM19-2]|uniref:DUF2927 domain-containing protein n=1 Tax=Sporolactobacillus sp. THM19-2 TaxID=2511171 RepID=UPI0013EC3CDC|nr:DUF2927 domain-containing protein [Sporolactobacillus sp. THM19-2]